MPAPPTRVRLTAEQKLALCRQHAEHPDLSLRSLCMWAGTALKLAKNPSPASLLLLFKAPVTEEAARDRPMLKTAQRVHCQALESALVRWIDRCEQLQLPIATWATIRAKAEKIRTVLLLTPSHRDDDRLKSLRFSDGWIQKLQKRHDIKPRRVHGEAASASALVVAEGRAALKALTSQYKPQDIFNMDESAYFYCTAATASVSRKSIAGRKKVKKRLTVALTTNADGSTRLPLLFVGTARQPRCFGGRSATELGVEYTSSAKGWMTTTLFCGWLEKFNERMKNEERGVLLLLDNASPHRVTEPLSNVSVSFLPPGTTAHLQPQDAGIIKAFKDQLLKVRNASIVDRLDSILDREENGGGVVSQEEIAALYDATVLDAMRWAEVAWDAVSGTTVANCWRHTGILADDVFELVAAMDKLQVALHSISSLA